MKYLFRVNNPTAYLIANQIIVEKNLSTQDCLFFCSTQSLYEIVNVKFKNKIVISDDFVGIHKMFVKSWAKYIRTIWVILRLTKFNKYELFVPHSCALFLQLLIRMPNCKYYNYIEEGSVAYQIHKIKVTKEYLLNLSIARKILPFLNHFGLLPYEMDRFQEGAKSYYCFSEHAFTFVKSQNQKVVLRHPKGDRDYSSYDGGYILCPSRATELNWITLNDDLNIIKKVIEKLPTDSKIFLNFHPRQSNKKKHELTKFCKSSSKLNISILSEDILVEDILLNSTNITIVSELSSLLVYAIIFNQKSISYFEPFSKLSFVEMSKESRFPPFAIDKIEFLNSNLNS